MRHHLQAVPCEATWINPNPKTLTPNTLLPPTSLGPLPPSQVVSPFATIPCQHIQTLFIRLTMCP